MNLIIAMVSIGIGGITIYELMHQRTAGAQRRSSRVRRLRAGAYLLPAATAAAVGATLAGAGHVIMHAGPHLTHIFPDVIRHIFHTSSYPTP